MTSAPDPTEPHESGSWRGELADRLWRTVSTTVRRAGGSSEERVRAVIQGLMKEEAFRTVLQSIVPKEAVGYVVRAIDGLKDELVAILSRQLQDFFNRVDLGYELQKIITSLSLEVKAEVRFIPNDKAVVRPDIKGTVALKRVEDEPTRRPRRKARRRAGARGRAAPAETGPETACAAPTVPGVEHPTEPGPEQEEALE